MKNTYDVIVVGLGAMGSASLYQLAGRGLKVLGIDQFSPPHSKGSTHGDTRILRRAIGEGAHYTPLSMRSYELFQEIANKTGVELFSKTGMLVISNVDKTKIVTEGDFFENTVAAAQEYGIRHDVLNAKQIRARFPQFKVNDDEKGYFEHDAGYLRPEECITSQLKLSVQLGATVNTNEQVKRLSANDDGVTIETDSQTYYAQHAVVSAGPWLAGLMGEDFKPLFKVYRQVQCWFDISKVYDDFKPENCPIYFWQLPGVDRWIYGFPALDGAAGGLKVSAPDHPDTVDPDSVEREITSEQIDSMYREYISPCLPQVGSRSLKRSVCLITVTPDSSFVIDRHPVWSRVIICSACSGHGFKHSAGIGECIAQLVTEDKTTIDISAFKFDRLLARTESSSGAPC